MTPTPFGICKHPLVKGMDFLGDHRAPECEIVSFGDMLEREWDTDAHFLTYMPSEEPWGGWCRINKTGSVLAEARKEGQDLLRHSFVLDWDTPEHAPWDKAKVTQEEYAERFDAACKKFPMLSDWAAFYFTRSGCRVVYLLDTPVPVDQSEPMIRWFITQANAAGLECDMLTDWTRLFRCPRVLRDDQRTEDQPYFDLFVQDGRTVRSAAMETIGVADALVERSPRIHDDPRPGRDEAMALIESPDGKPTEWFKLARRRLKGRECFPCIFEAAPIAEPGSRDTTIVQYAGQVAALTFNLEYSSKAAMYALLMPSVEQLGDEWLDILWSAVGRMWEREAAHHEVKKDERKQEFEKRVETKNTIVGGMRDWCNAPELFQDERKAMDWISRRLIVSADTEYYLIREDGRYRPQPLRSTQLVAAIRSQCPHLITTEAPKADGTGMKDIPHQNIINRHSTIVREIVAKPNIDGAYIENIDEPHARLVVPSFRLNPNLTPKYDKAVDDWLHAFFGRRVNDALAWIAYALAFDEGPICAMSIVGGQGVGKKMLAQGLSECLEVPALATDDDLIGQYQYGLLRSPFLVVNEGWGSAKGGKHPADRFRELVGGDEIQVQQKFRAPIAVRNPMRVLFTANNLDVIKMLAGKRDLSQADREALAIRLLHFDVGSDASVWLSKQGGVDFTRGWIASDDGKGKSDYRVARHFLHLHSQRHIWARGTRLLVEGSGSRELMMVMQTEAGSSPEVIETIVKMVEDITSGNRPGMVIDQDTGKVLLVVSSVVDYWRQKMANDHRGRIITVDKVRNVLQGVADRVDAADSKVYGNAHWYELDLLKIREAAERAGWRTTKIRELLAKQTREDFLEKGRNVL